MKDSKIQWCHHTFNPWIGCTKVNDDCRFCYAEEQMDLRWGKAKWGPGGTRIRTSEDYWRQPIAWNKAAEQAVERHRVFCASLADVFEDKPGQPGLREWRDDLFCLIDTTPHLDWLLLTKRPENIGPMWSPRFQHRGNVWLGTSCGHQAAVDKHAPELIKCRDRSPVLFLSCEPLIGAVDLTRYLDQIDWVIVGGESGRNARPCDAQWVDSVIGQCRTTKVACFDKQLGSHHRSSNEGGIVRIRFKDKKGGDPTEWPDELRVREFPVPRRSHALATAGE